METGEILSHSFVNTLNFFAINCSVSQRESSVNKNCELSQFFSEIQCGFKKLIPRSIKKGIKHYASDLFFNKTIEQRIFLPVTDVYNLSQDISRCILPTEELSIHNAFYGIAQVLKHYVGLPESYGLKAAYTHIFYGQPSRDDYDAPVPVCLAWGDPMRKEILNYTKKTVFAVGPPLAYAQNLYDQQKIAEEKARLGRNAVIFPAHSTHHFQAEYSPNFLLELARDLKKQFNSVRFCIYWKDCLSGNAKEFLESEFECVTAGHIFDPLFFSRLKAILSVADHTFGNTFGTHSGLSIGMNVPHTIFYQKIVHSDSCDKEGDKYMLKFAEFCELFSEITPVVTAKQKEIVDRYWGFSDIKTPGELRKILQFAEERYQENK